MVAAHDLCQDLGITQDDLSQHRKNDPKLNKLVADYEDVDKRTVDAEQTNAAIISDEELVALKEERLKIKDQITQRLQDSQA
ncbi:DUF465 domain-containing protein [uncultured Halopseudomonas sp.]|jgi:uncharacterized protein YdcH (DUF465 family)|uniref:YdcH family protein n=1 Tax=uncultured Halopseudomonas sp. TaxID=2901193 RepID=UPI0030EB9DDD|tara:strand:- start:7013 stop:7258 length:246 start_codon:yes stop_codon:yes gene_type:complete